jgi:endonuclease I
VFVHQTKNQRSVGLLIFLAALWVSLAGPVLADPPSGYYDTADLSTPETLRNSVHLIIDGHTKIPYTASSTDTWNVLELADQDPFNSGRILDLYQNRTFPKYGAGNNDYNREHTWPKSYGFPDDGSGNKPYSDCHHLFLCDIGYNGDRGSNIFDDCLSGCTARTADDYNDQSGVNLFKSATPIGIWETWEGRKGDVARAMFYMDVRYEGDSGEIDLILTDDPYLILSCQTGDNEAVGYMGLLEVIVQWHLDDPVDDVERRHNDIVAQYQGNRNPFVDHPDWAGYIFAGLPLTSGVQDGLPEATNLIASIYPNPFNPSTSISLELAQEGPLLVEIYSLEGKLVRTLINEVRPAGEMVLRWNGRNNAGGLVSSGTYFCRSRGNGQLDTAKMVLLK